MSIFFLNLGRWISIDFWPAPVLDDTRLTFLAAHRFSPISFYHQAIMIAPLSVTGGRAVTLHQLKTWRCPNSFADALPGICA